ncbi:MAG TPA: copper resistance protein CopC [Ktedonobacterales bacterium]|nr:copper resistance protein CopC [Ktedonobacterales bacterium]
MPAMIVPIRAAGAVLATAPTQVTVHFQEHVNPAGANGTPSSLQVFLNTDLKNTDYSDQDATLVSTDMGHVLATDTKTMTVGMKGAGNGIYEVYWHTVSADDGDPDSGVFFFGVGTGSLQGVVVVTKTVTNTVSAGPPIWVTILIGIVALVLGGGIVARLRRRPQAAGVAPGGITAASPPDGTPTEKR